MIESLKSFLKLESAGGILLIIATFLALVFANTDLTGAYQAFLRIPVEIRFAEFQIAKPLLLWVNDGLMAVFFFLIGLELKRELIDGELSQLNKLILPAMRWSELYGVSILCGIGFTMSLFISSLAFEQNGTDYLPVDRLGILIGSFATAIFGYVYLNWILPKKTD